MLTSSIGWILIVSGLITAGGGVAALFLPKLFLRVALGDGSPMTRSCSLCGTGACSSPPWAH